jgi:hypothetical protein
MFLQMVFILDIFMFKIFKLRKRISYSLSLQPLPIYVNVAWAHLHFPIVCVNLFNSMNFIYLLFFALLFFKLLFHIFLSCFLQICVINLIHVGLGMKQALRVYFPIHKFQLNDF